MNQYAYLILLFSFLVYYFFWRKRRLQQEEDARFRKKKLPSEPSTANNVLSSGDFKEDGSPSYPNYGATAQSMEIPQSQFKSNTFASFWPFWRTADEQRHPSAKIQLFEEETGNAKLGGYTGPYGGREMNRNKSEQSTKDSSVQRSGSQSTSRPPKRKKLGKFDRPDSLFVYVAPERPHFVPKLRNLADMHAKKKEKPFKLAPSWSFWGSTENDSCSEGTSSSSAATPPVHHAVQNPTLHSGVHSAYSTPPLPSPHHQPRTANDQRI